jgi:predicted ABC-type transport system involved in lysophospholipase L1 biosynthesis ATPase subunit
MSGGMALLELEGVKKSFTRGGETVSVLAGVDFRLAEGETCAIVGPSGSGKSTLLAILGGLEPPTSGRARYEGQDLFALSEVELARLRNRAFGFLFQSQHLLPQLSALENALVPTLVKGGENLRAEREERALELFARVGLSTRLAHRPGELSGGERARVALVRALVNRPRVLFADEPTGALDARTAEELGELLATLNERDGTALVVVTHAERLAARMGRVLALEGGRLVAR